MPESPDFDAIARKHLDAIDEDLVDGRIDRLVTAFAEQLRLVWNARGAADLEKVKASVDMACEVIRGEYGADSLTAYDLDDALVQLRSLDR